MPHKRNLELPERIAANAWSGPTPWRRSSVAVARARHQPVTVERVILPDPTIMLDYLLHPATFIVEGLDVTRPAWPRILS
jgi:adenylosuccinate lyase